MQSGTLEELHMLGISFNFLLMRFMDRKIEIIKYYETDMPCCYALQHVNDRK